MTHQWCFTAERLDGWHRRCSRCGVEKRRRDAMGGDEETWRYPGRSWRPMPVPRCEP